jgi:hypothetical protein
MRARLDEQLDDCMATAIVDPTEDAETTVDKRDRSAIVQQMPVAAFGDPSGSARSRLLSREIGGRGRCDRRGAGRHREDAHVLRAQTHGEPVEGGWLKMSLDRASVRRSCERDATSVTQPDFIFLDAVSERRYSFAVKGEREHDRKARSHLPVARNIGRLGRGQRA